MALKCFIFVVLLLSPYHVEVNAHGAHGQWKRTNEKLMELAKQVWMQQSYVEEQARAQGQSGLKEMRLRTHGSRPFFGTSFADLTTNAAIHDHPEYYNTLGMGELAAALNGIHFKTRHNDYKLVRKADVGCGYDDTISIPYPEVPPSVKGTVEEQVAEMVEYFRAFAEQNVTIRDYRPYFKANLCYLMGAWTKADPDTIQEAFDSDRHHYDAASWDELYEGAFFESNTGTKHNLENFAFMPRRLWEVKDNGEMVFAQWNYKILCHPLKDDLPTNRFRPADDLKTRLTLLKSYDDFGKKRAARFQLNVKDQEFVYDTKMAYGLLDEFMGQIPGPDGYGASLVDDAFGFVTRKYGQSDSDTTPLNTAYFYRWFQYDTEDAMNSKNRHKGFNDENLWMAMTTQDNVLPVRLEHQDLVTGEWQSWEQKWVYAIPLEIVYTSPLGKWNPYNITYKGDASSEAGQTVYDGPRGDGTRDGTADPDLAYDGANSKTFYMTPHLFGFREDTSEPADSTKQYVWVLNNEGEMCKVRASGIRTLFPYFDGIRPIRQRYPIYPIYGEGSPLWRELDALKMIITKSKSFDFMFIEPLHSQPV